MESDASQESLLPINIFEGSLMPALDLPHVRIVLPTLISLQPRSPHEWFRAVAGSPASSKYEGSIAPIMLSILGVIAWLIFILPYALDWLSGYSLFQNIIVTVVSFLIAGLLIGR